MLSRFATLLLFNPVRDSSHIRIEATYYSIVEECVPESKDRYNILIKTCSISKTGRPYIPYYLNISLESSLLYCETRVELCGIGTDISYHGHKRLLASQRLERWSSPQK